MHTKLTLEKKILPPLLLDSNSQSFDGKSGALTNKLSQILFGVRSTPVLPQWHVKDPSHSAKSAGGRLHLNMHTHLTQRSRSGLTMPLSRHSVGTYQETSSHATRQGTLGHSRLSSMSHCGLILAERVESVYPS